MPESQTPPLTAQASGGVARLANTPAILAGLFMLICLAFVFPVWLYCGDEGYYALAGRHVLRGMRPYRDFLFIQMPLLAYAYAGWFALVPASIQNGKLLAAIMATTGVILSLLTCQRLGGRRTAILAGMLWLSSVHVACDLSTIKTQPLAHILLCAAVYFMARLQDCGQLHWAALAMLSMSLACFTRLTLAIPLLFAWAYLAWECHRRIVPYLALLAANIVLLAAAIGFFWADGRMWFGIYVTHHDFYGAAPWTWGRLLWTVKGWLGNQLIIAFVFAFAMILFTRQAFDRRNWPRLGLPAFLLASYWAVSLAHWAQVQNYPTHHSVITVLAVVFSALMLQPLVDGLLPGQARLAAAAFVVACFIALPFNELNPSERFVRMGKPDMFQEAQSLLRKHAPEGATLLSFNVELAVDGNYDVFPGCDMSDWSYMAGVSDEMADRFHLLNLSGLKAALREAKAPIFTVMDRDFQIMAAGNPEVAKELKSLIDERYHNVGVVKRYGQFAQDLFIFKRMEKP